MVRATTAQVLAELAVVARLGCGGADRVVRSEVGAMSRPWPVPGRPNLAYVGTVKSAAVSVAYGFLSQRPNLEGHPITRIGKMYFPQNHPLHIEVSDPLGRLGRWDRTR